MVKKILIREPFTFIKNIAPGLMACIIIAYGAKFAGGLLPGLGSAPLAIFFGIAAGNVLSKREGLASGTKFAESTLLSFAIVLLGGTLGIQTLAQIGWGGLAFVIAEMIITIMAAILIGKKLQFSENFQFLMASGNAVCGSSAIAATAPVIGADEQERGVSVAVVNVTGTVWMMLLPLLAGFLYKLEAEPTSALIGGVLQSVGQVVASSSLVNEEVRDLATIFKMGRIIFLIAVVLAFAAIKARSPQYEGHPSKMKKGGIPWFVTGFFIMCLLYTAGAIPVWGANIMKTASSHLELIALAGIGLRIDFKGLAKTGKRTALYALLISAVQIGAAILLIGLFIQ